MIYYFHMLNIYPSEHSLSNANLIGCDLLYTIQSLITGLFSQYKWQLNSVWHTPVSLSLCIYLPRRTADSFEAATKKVQQPTLSHQYSRHSFLFAWHPKHRVRLRDRGLRCEARNILTLCAMSGKNRKDFQYGSPFVFRIAFLLL